MRRLLLYLVTACTELIGGVPPVLWLHGRLPVWSLIPAALAGWLFYKLLTLHSDPKRFYAAYAFLYLVAMLLLPFFYGEEQL
jgi:small multidrug resistance family-3 protein